MPIESRFSLQVPRVSLPTYLFTTPALPLSTVPVPIDEKKPSTHYLSLSTYRSWSKRLAAGFPSAGLQSGDRVLLFSPNSVFAPVSFMGIVMAGRICTGLSPGSGVREVVYQLRDSGANGF
jgi:4-coumarate--CoA ligase